MYTIEARNVNDAYASALTLLRTRGVEWGSRNGAMIEIDAPVVTTYRSPKERVLFDADRDANPFFHFFEGLWMLQGCRDVAFVQHFAKNMANFSDDGKILHGAYGHRWRQHWDKDQIEITIKRLREDPMSRREVTTMWDPEVDYPPWSKDHPCNTHIYWRLRGSELSMTVCNRSNDAIWGAYGANAVHMSMLHEYVASCVGAEVGPYHQMSNSLHLYPEHHKHLLDTNPIGCPYTENEVVGFDMMPHSNMKDDFDRDLAQFFDPGVPWTSWRTLFFAAVVMPMWDAHQSHKAGKIGNAQNDISKCASSDWRLAVTDWLERRK